MVGDDVYVQVVGFGGLVIFGLLCTIALCPLVMNVVFTKERSKERERTKSDWSRRSLKLVGGSGWARDGWLYTTAQAGRLAGATAFSTTLWGSGHNAGTIPPKFRVPPSKSPILQRIRRLGTWDPDRRTPPLHLGSARQQPHLCVVSGRHNGISVSVDRPMVACRSR